MHGSAARSSLAPLVGGARKLTQPPGDTAAIARMNETCQTASPMPGLAWITALPAVDWVTLITAPKVAICGFRARSRKVETRFGTRPCFNLRDHAHRFVRICIAGGPHCVAAGLAARCRPPPGGAAGYCG